MERRALLSSFDVVDDWPRGAELAAEVGSGSVSVELPSFQAIDPLDIDGTTEDKPQSKLWKYDNHWWLVAANGSGTWVWRLDGDAWTAVYKITSSHSYHADVRPLGNLVHVLLLNGDSSKLASLEYVPGGAGSYRAWTERTSLTTIDLSNDAESATLDVDSNGRMWVASDVETTIEVRYSDSPYGSFSAPITLATGLDRDDLGAVRAFGGNKVGVFWSNQATERFGFRVHNDSAAPNNWGNDELPASQSALNTGGGMADDHMSFAATADGTLYVAAKTSYNKTGLPLICLLVRRPNGAWDDLYYVDDRGTRPIIALNESLGKVLVIYRSTGSDGPIVFRESALSPIQFGAEQTLIPGSSVNDPTGSKQNFTSDLVVAASAGGTLYSVLATYALPTPVNTAPTVTAGPDRTVELDVAAVLDGSASDDGLPNPPGALATTWSKVSGPGSVAFANPSAVDTTATFGATGSYVLRLTANDSELSAADDVTVTVTPNNAPPSVNAGPNRTVEVLVPLAINATVSDDGLPDPPGRLTIAWTKDLGPGTVTFSYPATVDTTVTFSAAGLYNLLLTVSDGAATVSNDVQVTVTAANVAPTVDAGVAQVFAINEPATLDGSASDDGLPNPPGALATTWSKVSGPGDVAFANPAALDTAVSFSVVGQYVLRLTADDSELSAADDVSVTITVANFPPTASAGTDRWAPLGASVSLHGAASDDGQPDPPGQLTFAWSQTSGPGTAAFSAPTEADTTVAFSAAGRYVLRFSAYDGRLTGFDEVIVDVVDPTQPITRSYQDGAWPTPDYAGTRDTKLRESRPLDAFGNSATLEADGAPGMVSLVQFDLEEIPPGSAVDEAALTLRVTGGSQTTFELFELLAAWTEEQSDWLSAAPNRPWVRPGAQHEEDRAGDAAATLTQASPATVTIALNSVGLAAVRRWINRPALNRGLLLTNLLTDDGLALASREAANPADRPKLTVVWRLPGVPPLNRPPQVSAGADQTAALHLGAQLDGAASDDGWPRPPGALTLAWSQVSGPGPVVFTDPELARTRATFAAAGSYVLRLTAFDGQASVSDELTILVEDLSIPVTVSFQDGVGPTAGYAGTRDTKLRFERPTNNYGAATHLDADGSPDFSSLVSWDLTAIPAGSVIQAAAVALNVTATSADTYELYRLTQPWTEGGATWNEANPGVAWEAAGAANHAAEVLGLLLAPAAGGATVPLTSAGLATVQDWVDHPERNFGLIVEDYLTASDALTFDSREAGTAAFRPQLTITYLRPGAPQSGGQGAGAAALHDAALLDPRVAALPPAESSPEPVRRRRRALR